MAECITRSEGESIDYTPTLAMTAGEVRQLPDGRAGYSAVGIADGIQGAIQVCGIVEVAKTLTMVMLKGSRVYWSYATNKASLKHANGRDFFLGTVVETAASAATTVKVNLNYCCERSLSLGQGFWAVPVAAAGPRACTIGHQEGVSFVLDATSEAQKLDALSCRSLSVLAPCMVEAVICLNVNGSGNTVDLNVGLANATHATDADSITELLAVHVDGGSLNIMALSRDGTTTVASTDTTVDAVVGTPFLVQWDLTDWADIQMYVDGVNVLPATVFKLDKATGPLKLLAHCEKSTGTEVGNITVMRLTAILRDE